MPPTWNIVLVVTIAAAGDLHASPATRAHVAESFEALEERVDVVLLAGDLTTHGEPALRRLYAETTVEVEAIRDGLQKVAHCPIRVVLLHYAPTSDTLHGEPEGIWTYLGCDRLATPIAEYRPDVVLHGHAHAGSFEGAIGTTPVYNVAVHVTGRDFYIFELEAHAVEVETRA